MEEVAFFAGAVGALGGAVAVIALRNPFYSVLALVVHLFSLAGLFLLLHAEFVAAAQIVVYAGAVMVLYVFVAAYVGGVEESVRQRFGAERLAPLVGALLFVELSIAIIGSGLKSLDTGGVTVPLGFGSPAAIGEILLEQFLIAFEAASLLLLIAAVGAVVLAGRRESSEPALAGVGSDKAPESNGFLGTLPGASPDPTPVVTGSPTLEKAVAGEGSGGPPQKAVSPSDPSPDAANAPDGEAS